MLNNRSILNKNKKINSECQKIQKYQHREQIHFTSNHWTQQQNMTFADVIPGLSTQTQLNMSHSIMLIGSPVVIQK